MNRSLGHEQARKLAAERLDEALSADDQAALDAHLAGCAACAATAAAYEADRVALRALPPIEPPRDLWARTSVALEREHAHGPRIARRLPRRWGPVAGLGSGLALILVLVIIGPSLIGTSTVPHSGGVVPSGLGATGPSQPAVTPIAVNSQVTWVETKGSDGLSLVTADLTSVCPTGAEPDCPPMAGVSRSLANLPTVPSSVMLSPTNASQAVVVAPSQDQAGTTMYVLSVPPAPTPLPAPSAPAPSAPASSAPAGSAPATSQGPASSPSQAPGLAAPTPSATPARTDQPSPSPTPRPSEVVGASPSPAEASPSTPASASQSPAVRPSVSPPPPGSPAPSAAATLAIVSGVTLVGDDAAYSSDGQWLAFSARPAGSTVGPDIYVWRAGWPAARPITSDHLSVFSGWVGGQILASRAIPDEAPTGSASPEPSGSPSAAPSPSAPAASAPSASAPGASQRPSSPQPSATAGSSPADGSLPAAGSPSPAPQLATPAAFLVNPATGQSTRLVGLDGWRPIVDPSGRWVVYWSGSLALDPDSGVWQPLKGQLDVASWPTVRTAPDGPTGAAAGRPLAFANVTDWEVRWDEAGQHLGLWVADPDNPGLGSLSLVTIDPTSGETSSAAPALLSATPAARGFALKDGQLVWASPPGQDGQGSLLSILAWSGPNAGKRTVESVGTGLLIVVP